MIVHNKNKNGKKGFAMLFAVLASSIVLSIGLSIFNLTIKELTLSSSGSESQIAFYAADTGAECALYWYFNGVNVFNPPSMSTSTPNPADPACINVSNILAVSSVNVGTATTTYTFDLPMASTAAGCARITVKTGEDLSGLRSTIIDSRGYSTNDCNSTDEDKVERGIKVSF